MGNDSPPHLSPNLHFNFQIKMPKPKLRAKMGLLKDATSNVPERPRTTSSVLGDSGSNLGVVLVGRASMRRLIDLCGAIQARDGKIDGSQENVDKDGLRGRSYEMCR